MPGNVDFKNCGHCKEELPSDGDHCLCSMCNAGYHFGECSMRKNSWKGLGTERQNAWICTTCRAKNKKPSISTDSEDITSLSSISSKLDQLLEIKSTVEGIQKSMDFLSSKYDSIINEMKALRDENKVLKKEVEELRRNQVKTDEAVEVLDQRVQELDMYGRRMNLEIFGVSVEGDHVKEEDTAEVVTKIAEQIGVTYKPQDIHKLHRLQPRSDGKPPTILVQFMSVVVRDAWLQAGKKARLVEKATGRKIFFNENLTPYYKRLLKEAKTRANLHNYKFVWIKNGKIHVRRSEHDRNVVIVRIPKDLNKIV